MIRSQKELSEAKHPTQALSSSERFILAFSQARDWVMGNQRTLLYIGVVLVLAVGGTVYFVIQNAKNNELASTYLTRVEQYYLNGDYRKAVDGDKSRRVQGEVIHGLKQIVDDYGSTTTGSHAALMLANAYYYLGKYDSADAAFGKATTATPIFAASIEAGHAAVLEAKSNKEEAAKLYEAAAKRDANNPLNADYLISAARDLQQIGKKDDAVKLYKSILEDYPNSQFDDYAKRMLLQMNVDFS
jgi:tetratricopeptide (TPR) repeat protein